MKKLQNNNSIKIGTVKLYLEDLQEILSILRKGGYSDIKIRTKDYEYSDNELTSIKIKDGYLCIFSIIPNYITIDFNERGSYVGVKINIPEGEDLKNDGVKYRIEKLLKKKERKLLNLITSLEFFILSALISSGVALYYSTTGMEYFIILFSIYVPLGSLYILPIRSNKIYLGSSPVDGIYLPNILALWRQKTCIEKNPEFETRKQGKLSSTFQLIFHHQKHMKLLV